MLLVPVQSKFPLGQIVITPNAMSRISPAEIQDALGRHASGDWGNLCSEDTEQNENALDYGGRLFSAYGANPKRFWIITEGNRSVTTILLPEDY